MPVDAFDNKQRLVSALWGSFPSGTLTLSVYATNRLVNQYWEQLRTNYIKNANASKEGNSQEDEQVRVCYSTYHHGLQAKNIWLLSSQVVII